VVGQIGGGAKKGRSKGKLVGTIGIGGLKNKHQRGVACVSIHIRAPGFDVQIPGRFREVREVGHLLCRVVTLVAIKCVDKRDWNYQGHP